MRGVFENDEGEAVGSRARFGQLAQQGALSPQSSSRAHHQRLRWFSRKEGSASPKIAAALSSRSSLKCCNRSVIKSDLHPPQRSLLRLGGKRREAFCGAMRRVDAITKELWRGELGSEKHVRFCDAPKRF